MEHEIVTVQIMLGGRSTRMGRDKALVELGGRTLLDRALDRWREYGGRWEIQSGGPWLRRGCLLWRTSIRTGGL